MSNTKSLVLEYYSIKEQFGLGLLNRAGGGDETSTSTPTSASGPGGSTSVGGGGSGGAGGGFSPVAIAGLIGTGRTVLSDLGKEFTAGAGEELRDVTSTAAQEFGGSATQAGKDVVDYATTKTPETARLAGSKFTSGVLSSLGTELSKPKTLAKLGAGALATGALVGGGMALGNRLFGRRPEKKKKKGQLLASSYNPYFRSAADIGGATGATAGTLGGLLGGRYAGAKAADALKLGQDSFGRTALQIGGQALGTVLGGTVGGILGYEALKRRKKKREENPMLPDMYRNA